MYCVSAVVPSARVNDPGVSTRSNTAAHDAFRYMALATTTTVSGANSSAILSMKPSVSSATHSFTAAAAASPDRRKSTMRTGAP